MAILDVGQIQEWKRKADLYDALVEAVGQLGGNPPGKRGRPRVAAGAKRKGPSRKGAKSLASSTSKRWARAEELFKAGKIKKKDLKLAAAYEAKHSNG